MRGVSIRDRAIKQVASSDIGPLHTCLVPLLQDILVLGRERILVLLSEQRKQVLGIRHGIQMQ